MKNRYKVVLSVLVVGVLGSLSALAIFGAFTATTSNAGNEIQSGNVTLGDNDSGSALYFLAGAAPGESVTKCIKVSYTGSLKSDVDLYTDDTNMGPLAQYVELAITQGTQASSTFPSCTGFTAAPTTEHPGGTLFSGTLQAFSNEHNTNANGIETEPVNEATGWVAGASLVYKFQVTLSPSAPVTAESQTTGEHGFIWEANSL
jgi:hypothetical protein